MFNIHPWSGGDYTISHNFDSARIPVGAFAQKNQSNITPYHINCGNYLIDTVWGIQANRATQVNNFPILPPKFEFMRFTPYYLATDKATRRAQFKCTYSTTIEFYQSPNTCINMFMLGNQAKRLSYLFKDPMQQAAADTTRFNFGVRPHQFIIPHTSFSFGIWKYQSDYPYRYEEIPATGNGTLYEKVGEVLTAANYNVEKTDHATLSDLEEASTERVQQLMDTNKLDGCSLPKVTTKGTTPHIVGQIMPQYSMSVMTSLGMTEDQNQNLMDDFDPPTDNGYVNPSEKGNLVEYSLNTAVDKGQYKSANIPLVRASQITK